MLTEHIPTIGFPSELLVRHGSSPFIVLIKKVQSQMTTPTSSPINSAVSQDGRSSAEEVVAYCVAKGLIAIPDGGHQREFSADELLKLKLARVLIENMRLLEILSKAYAKLNMESGIELNNDRIAANEKHTLDLVQFLLVDFPESTFQTSE